MAYPISANALELFMKPYRQVVNITLDGTNDSLKITEKDIPLGGLSVNRYCTSGDKIEIGSVIASELTLTLDNTDGRYDNIAFEGAELFVQVGVKKWDAKAWENANYYYIPFGYFTVDETPRKLQSITLTALDRMVHFDKPVDKSLLSFPMTVESLLKQICNICNIICDTDLKTLPNYDYEILECPTDEDSTYRQYLSWIAEITGTCGFINWNGHLVLQWYTPTDTVISPSERYSSDLQENAITLTGVQVVGENGDVFLTGDDGYVINIESNALIQNNHRDIAESLYQVLGDFTYTPFTALVKPMPHLYPLDMVNFVDKQGVPHPTIITDITYVLNQNTSIAGKGETTTKSGYASSNPLTKQESLIIKTIKNALNETLNNSVQSVLAFNELITNSLGVYSTTVKLPDGSVKYYMHDSPTLETSTSIYTRNAGGFAFTNSGWNGGNPVWESGFTKNGNIIAKKVNAYGIEVSDPNTKYSSQITPGVFSVWYGAMQILTVNGDESVFTKLKVKDQAECGKIRFIPHYQDGKLNGTNLVFIDD